MGALPQLDKGYHFAVVDDPEGKGFLVYALATSRNPADIVLGLHYRVTVSSEGKVQRADSLALAPLVMRGDGSGLPVGSHQVGFYCICLVSTQPLETHVSLSLLHKQPCVVGTSDHSIWSIENGKISKQSKKK